MEPRLLGLFICELVLRELTDDNKLSFVNVFSGYNTIQLPFVCPRMFMVSRYGGGQGEYRHHFEIRDNADQVMQKSPEAKFFLENRTSEHVNIHSVEGLIFPHPGFYWIVSLINGREFERISLSINYITPQPVQME